MNPALLIHAIVRQTMVLTATLATASGQRAQLAQVANQVFSDLVRELREQGLGNKVIADMFGMALRTYHRKIARLSTSHTVQGRSLWEAVLEHVQEHGPLLRNELLQRFSKDDEAVLCSVLADLAESGLVQLEGPGRAAKVHAAAAAFAHDEAVGTRLESMVLVALLRNGRSSLQEVADVIPAEATLLGAALTKLVREGMATQSPSGQGAEEARYGCETCLIPFGDAAGWEAAVFDHYQALVVALVTKLRAGKRRASLDDSTGGSTFTFDIWEGHPMQAEVLGHLKAVREQGMALRRAVEQHNAQAPMPPGAKALQVTAYVGQGVVELEEDQDA